jgi:putative oxidoreductase
MGSPIHTGDAVLDGVARNIHWALRVGLAAVFIYMGIDKFMGSGIAGFANVFGLPVFLATLVALGEIAGGLLILVGGATNGWVTRLGAAAMIGILLGAIFMAKWGQWHFMPSPGYPMGGMMFEVTLLLVGIYFLVRGNDV